MIEQVLVGAQPMWMRAVMVKEGDDVVTRCCVVTEGQFFPIEVRVNIPGLIATAKRLGLHDERDAVGAFGFLKKAARAVTKNKLVKAVGKVAQKVVKNPVAQVAIAAVNPAVLLGMHNASAFTGGKGILPKPIASIVNTANRAALNAALPVIGPKALSAAQQLGKQVRSGKSPFDALPSIGLGALGHVAPQASAALGLGLKTVMTAKAGRSISTVARAAQKQVARGKAVAQAVAKKQVSISKAKPLLEQAVQTRKLVQKLSPALAKKAIESANVRKKIADISKAAKAGNLDAKQTAAIIAKASQTLSKVQRLQLEAAGGVPGLLVTSQGKIVRAPRGRFRLRTTSSSRPDLLYRGPKQAPLEGLFTAVSGCVGSDAAVDVIDTEGYPSVDGYQPHRTSGWGGNDDPGNDIEGPRPAVRYAERFVLPDRTEPGAWTP